MSRLDNARSQRAHWMCSTNLLQLAFCWKLWRRRYRRWWTDEQDKSIQETGCSDQLFRGGKILARSGAKHPGESPRSTAAAVLIAEDEETVRTLAATTLERAGFLVLPACNGEAAIEMFRHGGVNVDALLTDVQMGNGITGLALAEHVLNERPEIAVLVMSGFPDAELLARERNLRFLAKPFTPVELVEQMRQALALNTSAHSKNTKNDDK